MPLTRRFLIAPSLTRLIRDRYGSEQVIEGHFAPHSDRQSHVKLQNGQARLVLTSFDASVDTPEDSAEVPMAHAQALLDVCPGKLIIERSIVQLTSHKAVVARFVSPGSLDLVSVEFATQADETKFEVPVWFGAEVSHDQSYLNRMIALSGLPSAAVTEVSNAALEALLDIMDGDGDRAPAAQAAEQDTVAKGAKRGRSVASGASVAPLPRTSAFSLPHNKGPAESEGRAAVHRVDAEHENADPLAGVIKGLSAALTDASPEMEPAEAGPGARFGSRATSH
jgi:CYTH domain-containing protein